MVASHEDDWYAVCAEHLDVVVSSITDPILCPLPALSN